MSLKKRWLASMLGIVLVGTAITTVVSSSISFHGARQGAYAWLINVHRDTIGSFDEQIFQRLEVQARLLARMPELGRAVSTRSPVALQAHLGVLQELPGADYWAVMGEDGTVITTSDPSCRLERVREQGLPTAEPTRSILMCGRLPVFAVTTAVRAEQGALGWLVLGLPIDEAYVDTAFVATGAELVLIDQEGLLATTFQDTSGKRIAPDLSPVPRDALWAEGVHFDKYELGIPHYRGYYARSRPLAAGVSTLSTYLLSVPLFPDQPQVPVRAVLIVPSETMDVGAFYSTVTMVFISLLLLPLLATIVWRLVNSLMQPISQCREMTARVAEGDLEGDLPVAREDELGELSRDFNDMVHKLRESQRRHVHAEKMAAVGQLAAGVGHEINNPLAYVAANLSFATETLAGLAGAQGSAALQPLPPELTEKLRDVSEALQEAQDGAWRVARIVRDLRTFAHADNTVEKQVLELRPIIEAALKLASNTLKQRARVRWDFQETPRVEAHEARLVQVIHNLLVNAAQAIPEGRVEDNEIRILSTLGADGSAVVEVSDTGQGMAPEVLERLFEPFFTTKPVGQGSGLSLSISRNIIEGLGGSLTFRSTVGGGSTFRITLPAAPQARQESP
ncbi:sensor histidine kinase, partial [Hyalangium sp.]|uniref:sensor histidine kinase n=1 Tax=Hyalangium sp. TaxID=2028555 RepID=UPI002D7348C5